MEEKKETAVYLSAEEAKRRDRETYDRVFTKEQQELVDKRIVLVATDIVKSMSIWEFIKLKLTNK